jgi:hypothetical protein
MVKIVIGFIALYFVYVIVFNKDSMMKNKNDWENERYTNELREKEKERQRNASRYVETIWNNKEINEKRYNNATKEQKSCVDIIFGKGKYANESFVWKLDECNIPYPEIE